MKNLSNQSWNFTSSDILNPKKRTPRVTSTGLSLNRLLLPDIELFRIVNKKYDKIMATMGFHRILGRRFLTTPYKNYPLNKYLIRMWTKLHKLAIQRDEKTFMILARLVMKKSNCARMLFLWRVERTWYRSLTIYQTFDMLTRLDRIIRKNSKKFSFKRIFIPKADNTLRPLAVPPLEWRIMKNWMNVYANI